MSQNNVTKLGSRVKDKGCISSRTSSIKYINHLLGHQVNYFIKCKAHTRHKEALIQPYTNIFNLVLLLGKGRNIQCK